jgi:hypothetical protein
MQIRSDKLKDLLSKHGGFGAVIAFKPTGWTFKGDAQQPHAPASITPAASFCAANENSSLAASCHGSHGPATHMVLQGDPTLHAEDTWVHSAGCDRDARDLCADIEPAQHMLAACSDQMEGLAAAASPAVATANDVDDDCGDVWCNVEGVLALQEIDC